MDENGRVLVEVDPLYFRPTEVETLMGDYSRAKNELKWEPKTRFNELVKLMVDFDLDNLKNGGEHHE